MTSGWISSAGSNSKRRIFLVPSKMKLFGVIIVLQIVRVYSASKIDDRAMTIAVADIVNKCFGSSKRWSELLIIAQHPHDEIIREIHEKSKTSNLILSPNKLDGRESRHPGKGNDYLNASVHWQKSKTTAVMMTIDNLKEVEFVLSFLKNSIEQIWRPESYFLIVLENECDAAEYKNMFKVIWSYWILNAVILCLLNDSANGNRSEIKLYTFNPHSGDHSRQWETIIHETIEVSIATGNFSHSWYIFNRRFNGIRSFEDCGDIFFDKTSNLDRYVIPISVIYPEFLLDTTKSTVAKLLAADSRTLKTISKKLRFDVAQVVNHERNMPGRLLENGSYSGMIGDIFKGRSYLGPTMRGINLYPNLGMTYPHDHSSGCIASRIVGNRPQWTNLAVAKHIWFGLGLGILFFTVVLYLQNKSRGIMSAFLEALRLIIGSSIIHTSTIIKHRIILGSIFLVVLVVDGTIRGRFISILTIVRPYPNLDTVEQLIEQDVDLYAIDVIKDQISNPQLKSRLIYSSTLQDCLKDLERIDHQRACFGSCEEMEFRTSNISNIYISSDPIWTRYVTFFTTMHWPMKYRYSFEVQKLVEAGIYKKWKHDIRRDAEVDGWKRKRAAEPPYVRSTKLNDLLPAFVLLFVGLSIALIVFAWEMKGRKNLCRV